MTWGNYRLLPLNALKGKQGVPRVRRDGGSLGGSQVRIVKKNGRASVAPAALLILVPQLNL